MHKERISVMFKYSFIHLFLTLWIMNPDFSRGSVYIITIKLYTHMHIVCVLHMLC